MRYSTLLLTGLVLLGGSRASAEDAIKIGTRLEPLVDMHLIATMNGVTRKLHKPVAREVILTTGEPWEGNTCAYYTIFRDGNLFRMYYRGSHADEKTQKSLHPEVTCYAESKDGIHWEKPKLGLYDWKGSKDNNIVWNGVGTHCFAPFKDNNPKAKPEARYKALSAGRHKGKSALFAFQSPDGIQWKLMRDTPVITFGAFDSQNLAFWDPLRKEYREYHRHFRDGKRVIMTGTSKDFISWTPPVYLEYGKAPKEHLYTNAIQSYPGASHLMVGFPTRYQPKNSQVEPVFMTSRNGKLFERWPEALIPITAPKDRDGNRSNYMTYGLLNLPGSPKEHSVFATEAYYAGPDTRVRRFSFRKDGFVSISGTGTMVTKPLVFAGKYLKLNYSCGNNGNIRVAVLSGGKPVGGFSLDDCAGLDSEGISERVEWINTDRLRTLAGKPIQLKFELKNADLYSIRFE